MAIRWPPGIPPWPSPFGWVCVYALHYPPGKLNPKNNREHLAGRSLPPLPGAHPVPLETNATISQQSSEKSKGQGR